MSIYRPAGGDRVQVMVAETVRRRRERQSIRKALLAARKAGKAARHRDRLRRAAAGEGRESA